MSARHRGEPPGATPDDGERGFLSRWSRRKRATPADEEDAPANIADASSDITPAPEMDPAPDDRDEATILAELGLPVPESLQKGDDVIAFMARAVPDAIRRRALRALWRTDPVLACIDGLNDYDGDYTGGGVPMGTLKSAYEVGRGYAKAVLAEADGPSKVAGKAEETEEAEAGTATEPSGQSAGSDEPPEEAPAALDVGADGDRPEAIPDAEPQPTRKRMRFAFSEPDPTMSGLTSRNPEL